jgi:GNAT superfamily N-acetyltransferase
MNIALGRIEQSKRDKKLLSKMVKGFLIDYTNQGDNVSGHSHSKIASSYIKGKSGEFASFVCDKNTKEIVGYVVVSPAEIFHIIDTVYILPEYRGKGYAQLVYAYLISVFDDTAISISMRRAKEKNKFFKDLGFTNFMGDIAVDDEGIEHIQIGDKGLCHLTTTGMIDNTVNNINKWQQIADDRSLSSKQRDIKLMAEMSINDTTKKLETA